MSNTVCLKMYNQNKEQFVFSKIYEEKDFEFQMIERIMAMDKYKEEKIMTAEIFFSKNSELLVFDVSHKPFVVKTLTYIF